MRFNISYPVTGQTKKVEIDDEKKVRIFYDRRIGDEVKGDILGDEYKGYTLKIRGGNDKQGFPMKAGVFANTRVRLLLKGRTSCYKPRRQGTARRKSVRGCICGPDLSVIDLTVTQKGDADLPGITDEEQPRRRGPKRANNIRKMFGLDKEDDVRRFVVSREVVKGDRTYVKRPKIQRLMTDRRIRRQKTLRRHNVERFQASKQAKANYDKLLSTYLKGKLKEKAEERKAYREAKEALKKKNETN